MAIINIINNYIITLLLLCFDDIHIYNVYLYLCDLRSKTGNSYLEEKKQANKQNVPQNCGK